MSVCQFARPRETARLSVEKLFVVFYIEDFFAILSRKFSIGQKYQAL